MMISRCASIRRNHYVQLLEGRYQTNFGLIKTFHKVIVDSSNQRANKTQSLIYVLAKLRCLYVMNKGYNPMPSAKVIKHALTRKESIDVNSFVTNKKHYYVMLLYIRIQSAKCIWTLGHLCCVFSCHSQKFGCQIL